MMLHQFLTLTAAYEVADVRRAMVAVLASDPPRSASEYRCFYTAVCLHLGVYAVPKDTRTVRPAGRDARASVETGAVAV